MILGLVAVSATIFWERLLFTGLFNFSHSYRVSGSIFGIMTGGAAIDAYLMMVTPFIGALILYRFRFWTLTPTICSCGIGELFPVCDLFARQLSCRAGYIFDIRRWRANGISVAQFHQTTPCNRCTDCLRAGWRDVLPFICRVQY